MVTAISARIRKLHAVLEGSKFACIRAAHTLLFVLLVAMSFTNEIQASHLFPQGNELDADQALIYFPFVSQTVGTYVKLNAATAVLMCPAPDPDLPDGLITICGGLDVPYILSGIGTNATTEWFCTLNGPVNNSTPPDHIGADYLIPIPTNSNLYFTVYAKNTMGTCIEWDTAYFRHSRPLADNNIDSLTCFRPGQGPSSGCEFCETEEVFVRFVPMDMTNTYGNEGIGEMEALFNINGTATWLAGVYNDNSYPLVPYCAISLGFFSGPQTLNITIDSFVDRWGCRYEASNTNLNITIEILEQQTPTFPDAGPYCLHDAAASLPTMSAEGITGSWNPSTINTSVVGTSTYTFIPDGNFCAISVDIDVEVIDRIDPTFLIIDEYCEGDIPQMLVDTSLESFQGTWLPDSIDTQTPGVTTYVFTPNAGVCANTFSVDINIDASTVPTFTLSDAYCVGDVPETLPTTSDNSLSGSWTPATISTATAGSTTYTWTPDPGICAATFELVVQVDDQIDPSFSFIDEYCVGDAADVLPGTSDNGVTGTWSPSSISTSSAGVFIYTFTPSGNGCANNESVQVTVNSVTTPTFSITDNYCVDDTPDVLAATSDNGVTGTWSPASITTNAAGTTTYTFTPDAGVCADVFTLDVTVDPLIDPTFVIDNAYCVGDTPDVLNGTSTNGINGTWSPSTISTASIGTTTYTFTPDPGFCANTFTVDVTVDDNFDPTFAISDMYCVDDTPDGLGTTSDNGITGAWSPSSISTATAGTTTYTFTPDAGQCANPYDITVTVDDNIDPTFVITDNYCVDDTPDVLAATSDNGVTGTWSPASITTTAAGTTTYTFTPDGTICANPFMITVVVEDNLLPAFAITDMYCLDDTPDVLGTTSDNGVTGTWSPSSITTTTAGTTTYTFTPDGAICADEYTFDVTVEDNLLPTFAITDMYCIDDTPDVLGTTSDNGVTGTWSPSSITTTTAGTTTYTFTPDGSICALPYSFDVTVEDNLDPTFSVDDMYCVDDTPDVLVTTSDNGVTGTWSPTTISTAAPGTLTYTFTPDGSVCANPFTLTVTVENNIHPSFSITDAYCVGDTPDVLATTSANGVTGTWNPATINTAVAGTINYVFTPDVGVCAFPFDIDITVEDVLTPTFSFPTVLCNVDNILSLPGVSDNGIPGTWSGTGVNAAGTQFDPNVLAVGFYTITFTPDADICADPFSITIEVDQCDCQDPLTVFAGDDVTVCDEVDYVLLGNIVGSTTQGSWTTSGDGVFSDPTDVGATYTFGANDIANNTVTLTLTSIDPDGPDEPCIALMDAVTITIGQTIIPTFDPISNLCEGDTPPTLPTTSTNGVEGTWDPSTINADVTGTFTFTFTANNPLCTEPLMMDVTIEENQLPTFADDFTYCLTDGIVTLPTISDNGITGEWEGTGVTANQIDVTDLGLGTYNFTFVPTSGTGICAENETFQIVVETCPCPDPATVDVLNRDTIICGLGVLDVSAVIGGSGIEGAWSTTGDGVFADPNATTTNYTFSQLDANQGSIFIKFTVDDPDGIGECMAVSDSFEVVINEEVGSEFSLPTELCVDDPYVNLPSTSDNGVTGTWNSSEIVTDVAGVFTFTFTVDPGSCARDTSIMVEIFDLVIPEFSFDLLFCAGDPDITLPTTSDNGIDGIWTGVGVNGSIFTVSTLNPGNYSIVFVPTSGLCVQEESVLITISDCGCSDPAFVTAGADVDVCGEDEVLLDAVLSGSASSATWTTVGDGIFDDATLLNATYIMGANDITNGTVTLIITTNDPDGAGVCSPASDELIITYTEEVEPTFNINSTVCNNDASFNLPLTSTNGIGGLWSGDGVVGIQFNPASANIGPNVIVFTPDAGTCADTFALTIIVEDCSGCANPPTADAGADLSLCGESSVTLAGSITNAASATWSSNGDGVFSDPMDVDATYTFGTNDLATGSVALSLTTEDPDGAGPCLPAMNTIVITVEEEVTPTVSLPSNICNNGVLLDLPNTSSNGVMGTWSGDGVTGTQFNPSAAPLGNVTLTFTPNNGICAVAVDVIITVDDCIGCTNPPSVDAGLAQMVCNVANVTLAGTIGGGATSSTWSSAGDGIFDDATKRDAVYTFGAADLAAGTVRLTITTDDPDGAGPCMAASMDVVITIEPFITPMVNLPATICNNAALLDLPLTSSNGINGTWSGTGVSGNQFDPTVAPLGNVTLTFTPDANFCADVVDVIIRVDDCINCPNPATADAGLDQEVCNQTQITLAGSFGGGASNATWTTSGDGSFDDATRLNAVYTFGAADLAAGMVILTITTDDPDGAGPCLAAFDAMEITIQALVVPSFDLPSMICNNDPVLALPSTSTNGVMGTWSGDGVTGNQFDPAAATLGNVTLIFTPDAELCAEAIMTDILVNDCLGCDNPPSANAGEDESLCNEPEVSLQGSIVNVANATWTTAGDGTFSDANDLNAVYTFGTDDIEAGAVVLTLTTEDPDGAGPCRVAEDEVMINIISMTKPSFGFNTVICNTAGLTNLPQISQEGVSGTWSGLGVNGNQLDPMVAGLGTHRLVFTPQVGLCADSSSMIVRIRDCTNPCLTERIVSGTYCPDEELTINGTIYNATNNTGTDTIFGATCDTIVRVNLKFNDPQVIFNLTENCDGQAFFNITGIIDMEMPVVCYFADQSVVIEHNVMQIEMADSITQATFVDAMACEIEVPMQWTGIAGNGEIIIDPAEVQMKYTDTAWVEVFTNVPMTNMRWEPALDVLCPTCEEVGFYPAESTLYRVFAEDENGCTYSASVFIDVIPFRVYVPTAFSPDGNGVNDRVRPYAENPFPVLSFEIYDRWGTKVHGEFDLLSDQLRGWNGEVKNKLMNVAVFPYVLIYLDPAGIKRSIHGEINLVN